MVPVKSSIGLISSKISSSPDCSGTSLSPAFLAVSMRPSQRSFPSSQSNDSVCRARRPGTSSGSLMRANEIRRVAEAVAEALRDAANRGPSRVHADFLRTHAKRPTDTPRVGSGMSRTSECSANWQCSRQLHCSSNVSHYEVHGSPQHGWFWAKRQVHRGRGGHLSNVTNATPGAWCGFHSSRVKLSVPRRRRPPDRQKAGGLRQGGVCPASIAMLAGHTPVRARLLDGDRRAGAFQRGLGLVGGLLVHPLEYRVRRAVHQVLGLLEAKAGQRPDFLDDLDLLVARRLQDDVELVLLLGLFRRGGAAGGGGLRHRDRSRGLHVEGLLELLHEVGQLKERHLLERVEEFVGAQLRHGGQSSVGSSVACAATSAAASSLVCESSVSVGVTASAAGASAGAAASAAVGASAARLASSAPASLAIWVG